jgi:ElaB/YqjD/DUF883 family membrane-anchored ribosome-binding protein
MSKTAQLEREAEDTRAQLAQTLDELRERITPGQLVDQAVDYAKDSGGGMFVRNLGRQTAANPLPVALIGAGLAWLMLANGRRSATTTASINRAAETAIDRARQSMTEVGEQAKEFGRSAKTKARTQASETAEDASDWTDDRSASASAATISSGRPLEDMADAAQASTWRSARDAAARAGAAADSVGNAAASAFDTAKSRASDAYERVAVQTQQTTADMRNAASSFGQRTADASKDFLQFCRSQPLLLAGLGMALGALIGAVIPATESEDALMGETSDEMKDQARGFAEEQVEKAKSTVKSAAQSAAQTGLNRAEAEFDFGRRQSQGEQLPAETSLVPDAEHDTEDNSAAESSNAPAERER